MFLFLVIVSDVNLENFFYKTIFSYLHHDGSEVQKTDSGVLQLALLTFMAVLVYRCN